MHRIRSLTVLAASLVAVTLLPDTAHAKRKSPLEGKPVVVRKLELRKLRFGITPFVGMSLSQTFVHKGYAGGKLHFDFTDWIGIQAKFAYGVINRDAKLLRALNDENGGLPRGIPANTAENPSAAPVRQTSDLASPAPLHHDFQSGLTRNQWLSSFDVVFKPDATCNALSRSALLHAATIVVDGELGEELRHEAIREIDITTTWEPREQRGARLLAPGLLREKIARARGA